MPQPRRESARETDDDRGFQPQPAILRAARQIDGNPIHLVAAVEHCRKHEPQTRSFRSATQLGNIGTKVLQQILRQITPVKRIQVLSTIL